VALATGAPVLAEEQPIQAATEVLAELATQRVTDVAVAVDAVEGEAAIVAAAAAVEAASREKVARPRPLQHRPLQQQSDYRPARDPL
jgi:hypothetical protein